MSGYDRRTVEAILTVAWDETVGYGVSQEYEPAHDMPKAKANPAHGNTILAMLADVHRAFDHSGLTITEKRALFLYFGCRWTYGMVAFNQSISESAARLRAERGVGRMVAWLNGETEEIDSDDD